MTAAEPMSSERLVTLPGHFHGFALMHIAMRRDAARLAAAARSANLGSPERIGAWWRGLRDVIDWHHHSEDEILWPELRRAVPSFAAAAAALDGDHAGLDKAMDTVGAALAPGAPATALVPAADAFGGLLRDHLATEEHVVFPAFTELGEQRYLALERRLLRTAPPRVLGHLQPWMFDAADPTSAAHVAATIPPPVRLLGRTVLRRRYERLLAPVVRHTGPVPPPRPKEKR
ncbi:hemerythrin domain-containing protein [Streptomyces sp. NBC_01089]|uniref:hemerythrin domain-containing protein n=1 Tax=Streptomyces sp. NBC_01089 TaxID=2903747 RepID=UPI0038660180|nr:hemerythrin domain-containing protein [Streptomyces sp. NBC_01089]WSU46304.1 hemerythrin domain-containing protein [Streptomyces sp. NBC_01089]